MAQRYQVQIDGPKSTDFAILLNKMDTVQGNLNLVNPGPLSLYEIVQLYKEVSQCWLVPIF